MPSINEVNCIAVLFNDELPLLFISASTPATAMYINPPAVKPCKLVEYKIWFRFWQENYELNFQPTRKALFTSIKDDCPGSCPISKACTKTDYSLSFFTLKIQIERENYRL